MDTNSEKTMPTVIPCEVEPTREITGSSPQPLYSTITKKSDCSRENEMKQADEKDSIEENKPMNPLPAKKEKKEVYKRPRSFGETYRMLLEDKKQENVSIDIPSSEVLNNIEFVEMGNRFHVVGFQELHSNLKLHIGDELEAINDLKILAVEDIKMFALRSTKTMLTLLIRRLPRGKILRFKREDFCDDWGFAIQGLKVIRLNPKMVALEEDECQAILGRDGEEWRLTEVNFLIQNLSQLKDSIQKEMQTIINNNLEFYLILQPAEYLQKIIQQIQK
uniref:uncharacterized protein isoform X1 n=1 Tax=Myxine glutinosa TaxID=7769 RepID=UPI00358F872B